MKTLDGSADVKELSMGQQMVDQAGYFSHLQVRFICIQ